jgi:SAM-dependent methyltransferase
MDDGRSAEQALSFGGAVEEYERARPTYPSEAADWAIPATAKTVVDVGAGTGKFTRSLVAKGLEVFAVEPDDTMRGTLGKSLPGVTALAGTAEHVPLPDDSVDVVTVAQAWHWMDHEVAKAEFARVLRPGGTLALVYNIRDERVDWVEKLGAIMHRSEAERMLEDEVTIGPPFGPTEVAQFDWAMLSNLDALIELVKSRSYVITATPAIRERYFDGIRNLVATDPELMLRDSFPLPYSTFVFRAQLG